MNDHVDALCRTRKLRSLLAMGEAAAIFAAASPRAVAEAQRLGPELTSFAVNTIIDGYQAGSDPVTAERAVDLGYRLGLLGTVAALVVCIERLSEYDPVANAAVRALDAMLDATGRHPTSSEERIRLVLASPPAEWLRVHRQALAVLAPGRSV